MMQCRLDHIFSKQMADIIIEKFEEYLRSKNVDGSLCRESYRA